MSNKKSAEGAKREVSVSGMSYLRGSSNYVWCTTSVLGKGATGAVYQGVNRHTGEAVAVKTFNQMSHMRPQEVQMREFEVLKKVNHRNIVKLLAIEEEQETRGKVIVMELCTGGSLFNILDDPENSHGLQEKEFLLVLHHLASGLKHLRDNHLVHRDLKPGNIMKFVGLDGSTTYKLTDFGAARELEDDQQFMSLYGTEEYLHPDMYERAVLRKTAGKSFGANVDLWSIGVTLYHVATGMLPFRPHGGRRNKETMHRITTEKQQGVISGVQTTENGAIEWSKDLPSTCQLSLGLRKLVTPLLGGLLEVDPNRMWSFESFFGEVTSLLARKKVYVFYVNKIQPLIMYLQTDHKFDQLRYLIQEQTDVSVNHQLLIFNNSLFRKLLHNPDVSNASSFPVTSEENPVMLFSSHDQDIVLTLPKTPSLKFPNFPSNKASVDQDALTGKNICSVGHAIYRVIKHQALCVALIHAAVDNFVNVLVSEVQGMSEESERLSECTLTVSEAFTQLVTHHRRYLTTCLLASPANDEVVPQEKQTVPQEPEDFESFIHVEGLEGGQAMESLRRKKYRRNSIGGIAGVRDQLEDTVNNVVDEEKKCRLSMERLSAVLSQLKSRVIDSNILEQTWQQHLHTINTNCNITTVPPNSKHRPTLPPPPVISSTPFMSLTPASMMVGISNETGVVGGDSALSAIKRTPAIATSLVAKLKDSWQHLLRDRATRNLTFNDEQFHLLEKLKMKETSKSLECLFGCCNSTINTTAEALADWCKVAQVQRVQADIASSDIVKHNLLLSKLQTDMRATQDTYHSLANRLLTLVQDSSIRLKGSTDRCFQRAVPAVATDAKDVGGRHPEDEAKAAVMRNVFRIQEKQEATIRLLEDSKLLAAKLSVNS